MLGLLPPRPRVPSAGPTCTPHPARPKCRGVLVAAAETPAWHHTEPGAQGFVLVAHSRSPQLLCGLSYLEAPPSPLRCPPMQPGPGRAGSPRACSLCLVPRGPHTVTPAPAGPEGLCRNVSRLCAWPCCLWGCGAAGGGGRGLLSPPASPAHDFDGLSRGGRAWGPLDPSFIPESGVSRTT